MLLKMYAYRIDAHTHTHTDANKQGDFSRFYTHTHTFALATHFGKL